MKMKTGIKTTLAWLLLILPVQVQGKTITCLCTTPDCVSAGRKTCNTTIMCYTQFLDKNDGSETLFRGCISNKTPILCENRPPAIPNADAKWPLLICCQQSYCNEDQTPPQRQVTRSPVNDTKTIYGSEPKIADMPPTERGPGKRSVIGPVYIAVLVIGICLLILIGAFAVVVLRRQNRFYSNNTFGIDRSSYLKGQCARDCAENGDTMTIPHTPINYKRELLAT